MATKGLWAKNLLNKARPTTNLVLSWRPGKKNPPLNFGPCWGMTMTIWDDAESYTVLFLKCNDFGAPLSQHWAVLQAWGKNTGRVTDIAHPWLWGSFIMYTHGIKSKVENWWRCLDFSLVLSSHIYPIIIDRLSVFYKMSLQGLQEQGLDFLKLESTTFRSLI